MKKRLLCAACACICLLLAGCSVLVVRDEAELFPAAPPEAQEAAAPQEPEHTPAPPEAREVEPRAFAAAPATKDAFVTVNQKRLHLYQGTDADLLRLDAFASAMGGTVHQRKQANGRYDCRLRTQPLLAYFHEDDGDAVFDGAHWYVPALRLLAQSGLRAFADAENDHTYYTTTPPGAQTPAGYAVPVLMYHAVSDACWGYTSLFVSPPSLERQLQLLLDEGYTPIWFEDLPYVESYEKPVILTFDDGYDDNFTELFPLLQEYGVKATIFVIAGQLGTPHKMTAEQVRTLSDSGLVSIQSHTMTHGFLDTMDEETLAYQLAQSQLEIARLTGKVPYTVCYPEGRSSALARTVAAQYYDFGTIMTGGCYTTGTDAFQIPRYFVSRTTDIWTFHSMLRGE